MLLLLSLLLLLLLLDYGDYNNYNDYDDYNDYGDYDDCVDYNDHDDYHHHRKVINAVNVVKKDDSVDGKARIEARREARARRPRSVADLTELKGQQAVAKLLGYMVVGQLIKKPRAKTKVGW